MTTALVADRLPGVDPIPTVQYPVFGVDPSTKRVAIAAILPGNLARVHVLSLPTGHFAKRLAGAHRELTLWLPRFSHAYGHPARILVEEPFGHGQGHVHPSSNRTLGVLLAALSEAFPHSELELIQPNQWKSRSVGHGAASKDAILAWAISACGYAGALQDEADALGVAWTAALASS